MTPSDFVELAPDAEGRARLGFDEARASAFAKGVAGDFNPLHDPGDRRFCVPGDLLFAVLLEHYGLHRETSVGFSAMVDAAAELTLPPLPESDGGDGARGGALHVLDAREREVLRFFAAGARVGDAAFLRALMLEYVRFSGRTFPEILVPLMRERGVMVNPERPLIIYKDMAIRIDPDVDLSGIAAPTLEPGAHRLAVNGRKGTASLRFAILEGPSVDGLSGGADRPGGADGTGGRRIGEGEKNFVLGGLREHDETVVQALVAEYGARREAWIEATTVEVEA